MKITNSLRDEAYNKLMRMMNYPGRFPILVIGETGTGKMHSIKKICSTVCKTTDQLFILNAGQSKESSDYWEGVLKESDKKYLVIKDVEQLSKINQELLFDAMSTTNGQYGLKKDYIVRILFTTTFSIKKIRDDRRYLNARFFDRISQFVVEFPNFDKTQRYIYDDFIATWDKMFKIDNVLIAEYPKLKELIEWLNSNAFRMYGNFRDLDKIAINWHFHQLNFIEENKDPYSDESEKSIFKFLKNELDKYLHNPSQKISEDNIFIFDEDLDYEKTINNFRLKLKKWAMALNNNDKHKTANMLGVSHRTLERWN